MTKDTIIGYNIIGYYKQWLLVEKDGTYYMCRRKVGILAKGSEDVATKAFALLIGGGITEDDLAKMMET